MRYVFGISFFSLMLIAPVLAMTMNNHAQSPFATLEVLDPTPDVASLDNEFLPDASIDEDSYHATCGDKSLMPKDAKEVAVDLTDEDPGMACWEESTVE